MARRRIESGTHAIPLSAGVHGRWLSPDPAGMAVVDLINSQSLNQYALLNNPIDYVNPDAPDLLLKNRSDPSVGDLKTGFL